MYKIESPQDGGTKPGPNFGLIVALFCAVILLMLGLALVLVPDFAKLVLPRHPDKHPTSQMLWPSETGRA